MTGFFLIAAVVLGTLSESALSRTPQRLTYPQIIDAYANGQAAFAFMALDRLSHEELEGGVDTLIARQTRPFFRRERLQLAVLLHTEAAIESGVGPGPTDFQDGWKRHMSASTKLRAVIEAEEPDSRFLLLWHLFMTTYLQGQGHLVAALSHAEDAPTTARSHPELLLARGAIHEMAWLAERAGGPGSGVDPDLRKAERLYREALAKRAGLAEARLRLGRVLLLRKEIGAGLECLAILDTNAESGFFYLARLFEGDALESQGDVASATRAYALAHDAFPLAGSAVFALAHLEYASGHRTSAAQRMYRHIQHERDATADPWKWYQRGVAWRAAGYLDALRAMVRP